MYSLKKLEEIGRGDRDFIENMVKLFCKQAKSSIVEIKAAEAAEDLEKIKKIAHKQKASIDSLSVETLKGTVREIEKSTAIPSKLIEEYCSKLNQVVSQIENEV